MNKLLYRLSVKQKLLMVLVTVAVAMWAITLVELLAFKDYAFEQRRGEVRQVVEVAHATLSHYHELSTAGELTEADAKAAALTALSTQRYGSSGYFWINDMGPVMIMHPHKPQLNGKDLSAVADPNGKHLFVEFVKTVKASGGGFVDYEWPRPGSDEPIPKVSYVKGFAPWGWIVGSGLYVDDVWQTVIQHALREVLLVAVFGVVIGAFMVVLGLSVTRPLKKVSQVLGAIADGDYSHRFTPSGTDELAQSMEAMNRMQEDLVTRLDKERQLAAETERVKLALDNADVSMMVADARQDIVYLNRQMEKFLGERAEEVRKHIPDFDPDAVLGKSIDLFHANPSHQRHLIEGMQAGFCSEIALGSRLLRIKADPVYKDAVRHGTVVLWEDITAERRTEDDVQEIVDGALAGDLTQRVPLEDKQGFVRNVSERINALVDINQRVVEELSRVLDAVAQGDLTEKVEGQFAGAFGKLQEDVNGTVGKLVQIIAEVKAGVSEVTRGAEEISSGNTDLSERTEQQASSLEETSRSMEQITGKVRLNAEAAREANQLAMSAHELAEAGGSVVGRAVDQMAQINESSKKIADIIGVIDELTFQTNLLALNAAVEAARAGEQGRGFAVVASEVRNLAQRSATAAQEIKELIEDSVTKVESGSKLVDESGRTLDEIVGAVKQVSDIVAQITTLSQEQSTGIEQVDREVGSMDRMTQQNAALVEEAAAASGAMAHQATRIGELVSFFRTDEGEQRLSAAVAMERDSCDEYRGPERRSAQRPWRDREKVVQSVENASPRPGNLKIAALNAEVPVADDDEWQEF